MDVTNSTLKSNSTEPKRLYRSKVDRIIAGVCGGFAEYFSIDPTLIRVLWLIVLFLSGFWFGILIYLVCVIGMRDNPYQSQAAKKPQNTGLYWGIGLILLGLSFFSSRWDWYGWDFPPFHWHFFGPWNFHWHRFWPILLILFGVFYLVYVLRQNHPSTTREHEPEAAEARPEITKQNGRLFRSRQERVIAGVCGGVAKFLTIDPAIVRIGWVILSLITGFIWGAIIYLLMVIFVPEEPMIAKSESHDILSTTTAPLPKTPKRVKKVPKQADDKTG